MSSLFEQLDLAAWQHELRDAHGRWTRGFAGTLGAMNWWVWEHPPKRGDRVRDSGGNGGWVRGVSADGNLAAIEFDDNKRQVVDLRNGRVLREFYGGVGEGDATDQELGDFYDVMHGRTPPPPPKPEAPSPDTEPPSEYGQNSSPVRALRKLFRNGELTNGDALPEDQPKEGSQGETEIVTLSDGSKVVFKSEDPDLADREELSYYVSQALGGKSGLPPIARNPDDPWQMVERVVPGKVGARYFEEHAGPDWGGADDYRWKLAEQKVADTPAGQEIGLLDYVTANSDRHSYNYLVDGQGNPHPIDMGMAQFDGDDYDSPFWSDADRPSPERVAKMEAELRKIEPEFRRLGHEDWYVVMMDTVSRLQATAPGFAGSGGDVIELTGSPAWLHELRGPNGEWVHSPADVPGKPGTPDRYKVPPHSRLINPRADHPDPADLPFFRKHPVSADNIIAAYDATPPEIKAEGMKWYHSAHLLARNMSHGNAEEGAILLGNYSSSANWPINMFRAARVADERKPIPVGEGYVSTDQFKKAVKALAGQHIDEVLTSPKTRSFAHLLAHGDDSPDDPYGHVVIDAHALNVAAGGSLRGATYARGKKQQELPDEENAGKALQDARGHEYVGDMYRQAASYIAHRDGIAISPYQMQAVTWVAQVLANQAEDKAMMEGQAAGGALGRAKGRIANEVKDWKTWLAWAKAHNFQLVPGVSALAGQALLAQVIELVGEDALTVQLAAWEHELRGPDGRWVKGGPSAAAHSQVEQQRSRHATEGDLRLALIKSQVYTTQQFDHMQDEINRLQAELDQENKDEAKAVLVTHLAWIGAGIAVALLATGVGLPPAIALLTATLPALGSEVSELAVVMGKGKHALAHPVDKIKQILHHNKPHLAFAGGPDLGPACTAVAQWLAQTGYDGPDADQIARVLVESWAEANAGRLEHTASLATQLVPAGGIGEQLYSRPFDLAYNPLEPRDVHGEWTRGGTGTALVEREREYQRTLISKQRQHAYPELTPAHARGNSRPVSAGPGQWRSYADSVQDGEPTDDNSQDK